jgi:hypothetical protein
MKHNVLVTGALFVLRYNDEGTFSAGPFKIETCLFSIGYADYF